MIIKHNNSEIGRHFGDIKEIPNHTTFKITRETVGEESSLSSIITPIDINILTIIKPSLVFTLFHKDVELGTTTELILDNDFLSSDSTDTLDKNQNIFYNELNSYIQNFKIDPISNFHVRASLKIEYILFNTELRSGYVFVGQLARLSNYDLSNLRRIEYYKEIEEKRKKIKNSDILSDDHLFENYDEYFYFLNRHTIEKPNDEYFEIFNGSKNGYNNFHEAIEKIKSKIQNNGFELYKAKKA